MSNIKNNRYNQNTIGVSNINRVNHSQTMKNINNLNTKDTALTLNFKYYTKKLYYFLQNNYNFKKKYMSRICFKISKVAKRVSHNSTGNHGNKNTIKRNITNKSTEHYSLNTTKINNNKENIKKHIIIIINKIYKDDANKIKTEIDSLEINDNNAKIIIHEYISLLKNTLDMLRTSDINKNPYLLKIIKDNIGLILYSLNKKFKCILTNNTTSTIERMFFSGLALATSLSRWYK